MVFGVYTRVWIIFSKLRFFHTTFSFVAARNYPHTFPVFISLQIYFSFSTLFFINFSSFIFCTSLKTGNIIKEFISSLSSLLTLRLSTEENLGEKLFHASARFFPCVALSIHVVQTRISECIRAATILSVVREIFKGREKTCRVDTLFQNDYY